MFQTIPNFLLAPFGEPAIKSNEMERKYQKLIQDKKISISSYCQIDDNHLVHLKIGSDTNTKESYDVVLLFFTDNDELKKSKSFRNYYVKFFSNSPSFIYQYAALYKQNGFLIDLFYDKMDKEFSDVLPTKKVSLCYDKSIYAACRYMEDHKANAYSVFIQSLKKVSEDKFIRGIRDFQDIKMTSELRSIDKKINTELKKNQQGNGSNFLHRRRSNQRTSGIKPTTVIKAKKPTTVNKVRKKVKRRSTIIKK